MIGVHIECICDLVLSSLKGFHNDGCDLVLSSTAYPYECRSSNGLDCPWWHCAPLFAIWFKASNRCDKWVWLWYGICFNCCTWVYFGFLITGLSLGELWFQFQFIATIKENYNLLIKFQGYKARYCCYFETVFLCIIFVWFLLSCWMPEYVSFFSCVVWFSSLSFRILFHYINTLIIKGLLSQFERM